MSQKRPKRLNRETVEAIFGAFAAAEPEPKTELDHTNPFTLLVAVVLSAQATDAGVNKATPALFKLADTPEKMVALGPVQIELEDDPVGRLGQLASLAGEDRTESPRCRPGAHHYPVAQLLQEPAVGRLDSPGYVEEDVVVHCARKNSFPTRRTSLSGSLTPATSSHPKIRRPSLNSWMNFFQSRRRFHPQLPSRNRIRARAICGGFLSSRR